MMNKTVKIILITAACLIPIGAIIAGIGFASGGNAGWSLSFTENGANVNSESVAQTVELKDFEDLELEISTMDVTIRRGDNYSISYVTRKGEEPVIEEKDKSVKIKQPNRLFVLFDFGGFNDQGYTITVPEGATIGVDAKISTGDLIVDRVNVTGRLVTSSGDLLINDTESEMLEIESSTGDIAFDKVNVAAISLGSSTGDINILRMFTDDFTCHTSTGDIDINNSQIKNAAVDSSTGDVAIALNGDPASYSYVIDTSTGDINVNGEESEKTYKNENGTDGKISVHTSTGDVNININ